jgi:creatinine amidohydrolase
MACDQPSQRIEAFPEAEITLRTERGWRLAIRAVQGALLGALMSGCALLPEPSNFIENLTWTEVRDAIASGKTTAIIYAGSTEQNGPHMVLGKHNLVARHVGRRIAAELGNALVYPIVPMAPTGDPESRTGHMRFPGSVSVSDATFKGMLSDLVRSAIAAGFRDVVLMGDHGGGQEVIAAVAREFNRTQSQRGGRVVHIDDLYARSQAMADAYFRERGLDPGGHAGLLDTSELMAVGGTRRWVRVGNLSPGNSDNGVEGDPRAANAELGEILIQFKVRAALEQISTSLAR